VLNSLPIPTSLGEFVANYSGRGLVSLEFPGSRRGGDGCESSQLVSPQVRRWYFLTALALEKALVGGRPGTLPPMDFSSRTEFQQRVWRALRRIAPGRTMSYAEVAASIGKPKATRAVGAACGANPIPVLIPCHRVLAARQGLGGFSAGLDWKRKLLAIEGVRLEA
jgi:O-6-methylguanine DNA methyltransferase